MREVAQRFLSGEDRKLATAKHLAHYVLALTEGEEEHDPVRCMTGEELAASMGPGWKFLPIPPQDLQRRLVTHLWTVHNWQETADRGKLYRSTRLAEWHAMEHRFGAGRGWVGDEHGHDADLEATAN